MHMFGAAILNKKQREFMAANTHKKDILEAAQNCVYDAIPTVVGGPCRERISNPH